MAGLRSDSGYARDEGGRLLAEYHTRVRQPSGADAFECAWFLTEAAALEGLFLPDSALLFIPRALQRCPTAARLHLAYAFVSEQQWLRGGLTPAQEAEVNRRIPSCSTTRIWFAARSSAPLADRTRPRRRSVPLSPRGPARSPRGLRS
jgi:hypothetical protein